MLHFALNGNRRAHIVPARKLADRQHIAISQWNVVVGSSTQRARKLQWYVLALDIRLRRAGVETSEVRFFRICAPL